MKIKTLTTYDVYNYGASLQAYALMTYLKKQGHEVEIINYQPHYLTRKYDYKWVNPESKMSRNKITRFIYRILKYLQRQTTLKRKKAFDIFNHKILNETPQKYTTLESLMSNPPEADIFIVGSDQIWNTFYETGRDGVFYLNFVEKGKKISYAASFSFLDISNENLTQIQNWLSRFDAVSIRESHGIDILNQINIKGTWVLDPVFLLDIDEWKEIMVSYHKEEKYMLVYDFEKNDELKAFALEYSKKHQLKIYSINDTYPLNYVDKNINNAGPKEFLTFIYHSDAFVSNSFHGTAFSIIFNKPVYVFNRSRHKVNSRMESLMNLFELKDCIIEQYSKNDSIQNYTFNFKQINDIKDREIIKSKQFLAAAL